MSLNLQKTLLNPSRPRHQREGMGAPRTWGVHLQGMVMMMKLVRESQVVVTPISFLSHRILISVAPS